jgi:thioredoxin reductase (NADPH)
VTDHPTRDSANPRNELERTAWPEPRGTAAEALEGSGTRRRFDAGHVFFDVGQDGYDLVWLLTGALDIVDRRSGSVVTRISAPHFVGEIGMLTGQKTFLAGVATEPCEAVVVPREALMRLVATVPEVADLVVAAFAARRRLLIEWREGGLLLVGEERDARTAELREFATRNGIPFEFVDRSDTAALERLAALHDLPTEGAVVVTGSSRVLAAPSRSELAEAIGIRLTLDATDLFDVAVVGGGPGGLAAAVYAASEGLCTVVIEDVAIGGQAGTSSRIENYLGFATGISGVDLAYQGVIQAVKFGAKLAVPCRAVGLRRDERRDCFEVTLDDGIETGRRIRARTVILANGIQYRRLPLPRLDAFEGRGVYYAATELEARFCRDTDAVIVGGGNSAGQAAMFLSRSARCTHVVVRGDGLSDTMSSYLSDRIESDDRIELVTGTRIEALHGDDHLEAVTLVETATGERRRIDTRALFIMIGAVPHTEWLEGVVALDDHGFVVTGAQGVESSPFETSLPGVFAVGDIRSGSVKRVASAVGEGSVAVSGVHSHLRNPSRANP